MKIVFPKNENIVFVIVLVFHKLAYKVLHTT